MPFPAQRAPAPFHDEMPGIPIRSRDSLAARELRQNPYVVSRSAFRHEGQLHEKARTFEKRMRAGMHLADVSRTLEWQAVFGQLAYVQPSTIVMAVGPCE